MSTKVLVCRCEDVTLHDVEEALDKGHDDLESVKRFTGFGTGWCQGKQCVGLIARLLSDRGGTTPTAPITPRQPFHPLPLADLARLVDEEEPA